MNSTDGWHKHIVATTADEILNEGEIHPLDFYANWQLPDNLDNKFKVMETGEYDLIVDLMSMSVCVKKAIQEDSYPDKYYVTGSALDNEVFELDNIENIEFKKSLSCKVGNIVLMDTPERGENTRYFVPVFEDVDLTFGKGYNSTLKATTDESTRGWSVSAPGDYMLYVSHAGHNYQGRLYKPRKQLYIVGGCCELSWNYWDASNNMFVPNPDNSEELVWEGVLKIGWNGDTEPDMFKILTEKDWMSETYHPYIANTSAEGTGSIRTTGGDDTKWRIQRDGSYKITVNTKYETITTELISAESIGLRDDRHNSGINTVDLDDVRLSCHGDMIELLESQEPVDVRIVDISGNIVAEIENATSGIVAQHIAKGIYIVSISGRSVYKYQKVKI